MGVRNQIGSIKDSFFKRYSLTTKLKSTITKRFTLTTYINLSNTDQRSAPAGLVGRIYGFRPDLPVYDSIGNYSFDPFASLENPIAFNASRTDIANLGLIASLEGSYEIIENLKIRSRVYLTHLKTTSKVTHPGITSAGRFDFNKGIPGGG